MIRGKVVMITGAARGIGASMARLLHHRGARLMLVDIDEHGVRTLAAELGDKDVACAISDVNDYEAMRAVAETRTPQAACRRTEMGRGGTLAQAGTFHPTRGAYVEQADCKDRDAIAESPSDHWLVDYPGYPCRHAYGLHSAAASMA
jgi:hypothetical protein